MINFCKSYYIRDLGWYRHIGYLKNPIKERVLNRSLKYMVSNKDYKDSVLVAFTFKDEDCYDYDDLDLCCQEAVDNRYNYCPDCGNDVSDFKYHHESRSYVSLDDENVRNKHPMTEEDFIDIYCKEYNVDKENFDVIDVYSTLYMKNDIFEKVKKELEAEGVEL